MTRTGELDARVSAIEGELAKLQKNQENLETGFSTFSEQVLRRLDEISGQLKPSREEPSSEKSGVAQSKTPEEKSTPEEFARSVVGNLHSNEASPVMAQKIKLPMFDGEDPLTWISKAEQFFAIQMTRPADRVTMAMVSMDGAALNWVRWLGQQRPNFSWKDLKLELVKRFFGTKGTNRFEQLSLLKQTGTVDDFVDELVACASHTLGLGNEQLLGYFLAGIRPEIRVDLQTFETTELFAAMDGARRVERKLNFAKGMGRGPWKRAAFGVGSSSKEWTTKYQLSQNSFAGSGTGQRDESVINWQSNVASSSSPNFLSSESSAGTLSSQNSLGLKSRNTRYLPPKELSDLKAKGLCYKCRQPYSPLHKCGEKVFKLVELKEDEFTGVQPGVELIRMSEIEAAGEPPDPDFQWLELPLNTMGGICNPRALKIRAKLGNRKIIVLIDSGASHNFINQRIVEVEELMVEQTGTFGVRLGNGHKVETRGICRKLPLQFSSYNAEVDCYPFDLGGIDLVLGYAWLFTLKKTIVDWEQMIIEFEEKGQHVIIRGDPTLAIINTVSCNVLQKGIEGSARTFIREPEEEATEMNAANLISQLIFSNLEDKVCPKGGGIVRKADYFGGKDIRIY